MRGQDRLTLTLLRHTGRFAWRVLKAFFRNRGLLLAGGIGYNFLLSIVPLFALLCVLLTHVVNEAQLLEILAIQARHLAPAHADVILDAVRTVLDSRDVIGVVGTLVLVVFSSLAFRMLEDAMAIIFHLPEDPAKRSAWVSALLPYGFMLVLGVGLLLLTLLVSLTNAANDLAIAIFGYGLPFAGASLGLLYLIGFIGMFALFSAIYKVLPVVQISLRRALIGGFVAALLWEGVRLFLMFYFSHLSVVNAVYGSLATLIILLLSLEIGAVILLLGGQVIAELERNARAGLPWYVDPSREPVTRVE